MSVQDSETATETGTMKAVNRLFTEIIDCRKQFVIPVFQRDFRWTQPQFQQLWRDVGRASGEKIDAHFIGSIVYIEAELAGAAFARWLLIDGQQRMTTLTLLMIALRDHIRDEKWSGDEDSPTIEKIDAYYLKTHRSPDDGNTSLCCVGKTMPRSRHWLTRNTRLNLETNALNCSSKLMIFSDPR